MLKPRIRNHIDIINSACEELGNLFKKWIGGTKSPVSDCDERVQVNHLSFVFVLSTKSLVTSDVHYLWKGIDFSGVIL